MAKFSGTATRPNVHAPVRTTNQRARTHEGATGWQRDPKSELYLFGITNMVSEGTFYESPVERDKRFRDLVHLVTSDDPEWVARFVPFLRDEMHLRSASVVMAAEYVAAGGPNGRSVVSSALRRADEPAEMLAYWRTEHGRKLPAAVKRGIADAVKRLYTTRNVLKYDGSGRAWRFADVIELVHPSPKAQWQSELFKYLLDSRHHGDGEAPESLKRIQAWVEAGASLDSIPEDVTWERLSTYRTMDAQAWEAVIPQMGYMALLRNLRNFDQAGVSDEVAETVAAKLADPEEVAKSRQFPLRFLSAAEQVTSLRWHGALEKAVQHSLANIPALPGKTLILVDVSGSMFYTVTERSKMQLYKVASLFGSALALRAEHADLIAYSSGADRLNFTPGTAALTLANAVAQAPCANGGTQTYQTLRATYAGHDRVIILTDEQAFAGNQGFDDIPLIYTFNLAGYRTGHLPSGEKGRYTFGGLTDAGFKALELLERADDADWPF